MNKLLYYILAVLALTSCQSSAPKQSEAPATDTPAVTAPAFSADSAFAYIEAQCNFGTRVPNSDAHLACGDYLVEKFKSFGLSVIEQKANLASWDGTLLNVRNITASLNPTAQKRILLCAHWDTRPWADNDPNPANHRTPVMGANDGASGVAVLLELARMSKDFPKDLGVDFVCFDAEDRGAPYWDEAKAPTDGTDWCLGSRYWAAEAQKQGYKAQFGILLDMVGGTDARFCYEGYSLRLARPVVARIWSTAARLGHKQLFPQKDGGWATDDHVAINEILGIPCADIIPYVENERSSFGKTWHTVDDTPANISKETLAAVGQTVKQILIEQK